MSLRLFTVGGILGYRALFAWASPPLLVATFVAMPLFQTLFFATVAGGHGSTGPAYFAIGNSVLAAAIAGVYGMSMVVAGERTEGTLGSLLMSPANRLAVFGGRAVPFIANGIVVAALTLACTGLVTGVRFTLGGLAVVAAAICVTAMSCCAFGALIGSLGLLGRDVPFLANLSYAGLLLVSGANLPAGTRSPVAAIGQFFPVQHGVRAARAALGYTGAGGGEWRLVLAEAAVGACWMIAAVFCYQWFEHRARVRGSVEMD
jgi:ABC-2 type transport system permease protein